MLYPILAAAVCLLVPWLPVLLYRSLPRRPPDPLSGEELGRLADELRPPGPVTELEVVSEGGSPAEVTGRPPVTPRAEPEGLPTPGEKAPQLTVPSYRWLNLAMLPVLIASFLALGAGWAWLLHVLAEEHARGFPPAVFLFKPFRYWAIFAVPGLFLGIFTSLPLGMGVVRLFMGRRRFLEYLFWDEGRLGPESTAGVINLLSGLAVLVGLPAAVFVFLAMNWYARFTEEGIAVKGLLAVGEEVHRYEDVEQIVVTSHRKVGKDVMEGEDLGVRFRDGRRWGTGQTFQLPRDAAERDRLIDFLRRVTGRPVIRARLLDDVPGG